MTENKNIRWGCLTFDKKGEQLNFMDNWTSKEKMILEALETGDVRRIEIWKSVLK